MRRWLLYGGLGLLLLLAGLALLANSDWARERVLETALEAVAPGAWSLQRSSGSLFGRLQLDGLVVTVSGSRLQAGSLTLTWQPWALLRGAPLAVDLELTDANLMLPPDDGTPPQPRTPPVLPELPLDAAQLRLRMLRLQVLDASGPLLPAPLDLRGTATLDGQVLRFEALQAQTAEAALDVSGQLELRDGLPLDLRLAARHPEAAGTLHLRGPVLQPDLDLALSRPLALQANGQLDLTPVQPRLSVDLAWAQLVHPALPAPLSIGGGSARLSGDAAALTLRLDTDLAVGGPVARLQASAAWQPGTLQVQGLNLQPATGGALTGSARLDLDRQQASVQLQAKGVQPAALLPAPPEQLPQWPGNLEMDLDAAGTWGATPRLDHATLTAGLDWLGRRLALQGDLAWENAGLAVRRLAVSSPGTQLTVSGRATAPGTPGTDLQMHFDVDDLASLWPDLAGSVQGSARLGDLRIPANATLQASATDLRWQDLHLDSLQIDGSTSIRADAALSAQASGIRLPGFTLDRVNLDHRLADGEHRLTLQASSAWGDLEATTAGRLDGPADSPEAVVGEVEALTIRGSPAGDWRLGAPSGYRLGTTTASLSGPLCLAQASGAGRICATQAALAADGPILALQLNDLPLALAGPWLPPGVTLDGGVDGTAGLDAAGIRLSLEHRGGRLAAQAEDGPAWDARLEQVNARLDSTGAGSRATLVADLGAEGNLDLAVHAAPDGALGGHIRAALPRLDLLTALLPQVTRSSGRLDADLAITGTTGAPALDGALTMQLDELVIPPLAPITALQLRLTGNPQGMVTLTGGTGAADSPGHLALSGELGPWQDGALPARVELHGQAWQAMDEDDLSLVVSPDLVARWDGERLDLGGEILVPSANVRFQQVSSNDVTLSDDVVIHRADGSAATPAVAIGADVTVRAGDDVRISGAGLNVQLGGQLRLRSEPGRPLQAAGSVRTLQGSYRAYGQDLTIYQGRLDFAGPIDNPTVNIRAGRRLEEADVEVGFQLSGFLRAMQADLYSRPDMPDADALAYLVAGRTLGGTTTTQAQMVNDAAVKLGVAAAAPVTAAVRQRLGIDELGVENPTDPDTGAVMVGKQLTDDLYVKYTYGLFNRGGGLLVRYRLTGNLSLQTEAGATRAVDLLYEVDFDSIEELFGDDHDPSPRAALEDP